MSTENILMGALVAQVALAAITWWPSNDTVAEAVALVDGGANSITALEIVAGREGAEPVSLKADNGVWSIASESDYPADADKVAEVLNKIAEIKTRTIVASSASSHEKLKVAASEFGRKITFTAGGNAKTIYVGSAKSKTINLRVDGTDDVYEVKGVSEFDLKDSARSFRPANVLDIDATTLNSLTLKTETVSLSFTKGESGWALDGGPEGLVADSTKVEELAGKVMKLRLQEPVGKSVDAAYGLGRASIAWTASEGGQTVPGSVELGIEKDNNVYAKIDTNPFVVMVPKYALAPLFDATVDDLTEPAPADAPPAGDAPEAPPAE